MPARPRHLALAAAVLGQAMGLGGLAAGQTVVVLPGTANTGITGISDDGTHVVGRRTGLGYFFWNSADGFVNLNRTTSSQAPLPMLSGDGVTMVALSGDTPTQSRTILATAAGGFNVLPFSVSGVSRSNPYGVSRDGSVVAGWDTNSAETAQVAWRWTTLGGMQALPFRSVTALSGDGNSVMGGDGSAASVVWRNGTITHLTTIPGSIGNQTGLFTTNYDGSIIGGISGNNPALWINGQGSLLTLPSGISGGSIRDINEDGTVAVGSMSRSGTGEPVTFIWTPQGGIREIGAYFSTIGVDLSPYRVTNAQVSSDGRTFGLQAQSSLDNSIRGIIVTIPCPATLGPLIALIAAGRRRR